MYSHNTFMKMPTVEMQAEGRSLSFLGDSGVTHSVIKRADVPNCKSSGHFICSVGAWGVWNFFRTGQMFLHWLHPEAQFSNYKFKFGPNHNTKPWFTIWFSIASVPHPISSPSGDCEKQSASWCQFHVTGTTALYRPCHPWFWCRWTPRS